MDYRKRSQPGLFCTSWILRNFWFFLAPLSSCSKILLSDHVHSIQTASQWASALYPASSYPSPPKAYDFVPLWARFTSIWLKEHQVRPPRCLFFYDLHFQRHLWPQSMGRPASLVYNLPTLASTSLSISNEWLCEHPYPLHLPILPHAATQSKENCNTNILIFPAQLLLFATWGILLLELSLVT